MKFGFAISVVLHSALLLWALVSIAATREFKPTEAEPIIAEMITQSDLNKLRQGARNAKLDDAQAKDLQKTDQPKKEAPKPKPVATPPPAAEPPPPPPEEAPKPPEPKAAEPPPPKAPEPPKIEPDKAALDQKLDELAMLQAAEEKRKADAAAKAAADAQAKADAKAKADADAKTKADAKARADKAKAEAKARADAKAKAEALAKEKAKSTADRVAALLDKTPDPKEAPAAAPQPAAPTKAKGPVKGAAEGRDSQNAGNEASMLLGMIVSKVKTCWNIQAGGEGVSQLVPVIRFELNRDGSVRGTPRVMNPQGTPQFQAAADAAMRAVLGCQNYELPADKYDKWKLVTLEFDPSQMF